MLNSQCLLGDQSYEIEFNQRTEKCISNLVTFKAQIKEKALSTDNKFY